MHSFQKLVPSSPKNLTHVISRSDPLTIVCSIDDFNYSSHNISLYINSKFVPYQNLRKEYNRIVYSVHNFIPTSGATLYECKSWNKNAGSEEVIQLHVYEMCKHSICLNGGSCIIKKGLQYCKCPPEYNGNLCQDYNPDIMTFTDAGITRTHQFFTGLVHKKGLRLRNSFISHPEITVFQQIEKKDEQTETSNSILVGENNYELVLNPMKNEESTRLLLTEEEQTQVQFIDAPENNYDNLNPNVKPHLSIKTLH
uniref:EGF-like domain-containing protein n=1 Tax=Rhabditophanes sp. KR3021 TaxID=114890 RepID=A0AC35U693_9BILA